MEFDRFSIALLVLRPDSPRLDKEAEAELQDAHMAHLADHEAGYLLAAGPLLGGPDEAFSRADYLERWTWKGSVVEGAGSCSPLPGGSRSKYYSG